LVGFAWNYNNPMHSLKILTWFIVMALGIGSIRQPRTALASRSSPARLSQTSASELILAMNTLRVSNGLPPLVENPIIDAVAQATAETMAVNQMSWHIGDVRGRLAAAGYGGGGTVWATENFAVGTGGMGIDEIMAIWADPDHMRPAVTPAYCNVGTGVATYDGKTYYVLQAAYVSGKACGDITSVPAGNTQTDSGSGYVSQIIIPVKIATPDADGKIYHVVQAGQSLWSIAIAYQLTIHDLEVWNNISRLTPLRTGQKLFIPGKETAGYATPTPLGMIIPSTPDTEGRIIHVVQPYQALSTIAEAYGVSVDRILALNRLQADWPLQVGQKVLISPGNITPSPTLSAIQKLTPEADGKYYHTVQSGQTLSWIEGLYNISLADLMNWNGLNNTSIIRPNQKLLLLVTPPATQTFTPAPPTATPSPAPSITPSLPAETPTPTVVPAGFLTDSFNPGWLFLGLAAVILMGGLLWWRSSRR
jgi:LysM repeat protein